MDINIIIATINCLATITAAFVTAIATIVGVKVAKSVKSVDQAEKSVVQAKQTVVKAEESIKEISENLPSWSELFEHDENGTPIRGNIDKLIEAVQKGYPIKVRINKRQKDDIEVMDAQWIFVENNIVVATNTDQISLGKDANGNYRYFEDAYHYYVLVNSKGQHHATRIYLDGKQRSQPTDGVRHMTWIGLIPPRV